MHLVLTDVSFLVALLLPGTLPVSLLSLFFSFTQLLYPFLWGTYPHTCFQVSLGFNGSQGPPLQNALPAGLESGAPKAVSPAGL